MRINLNSGVQGIWLWASGCTHLNFILSYADCGIQHSAVNPKFHTVAEIYGLHLGKSQVAKNKLFLNM